MTPNFQLSATKALSNVTDVPGLPASVPEERRLVTEWLSKIRVGDSGLVRLILEMDEYGNVTPTGSVGGDQISVESVFTPNLFETHQIIAQARLDLSGMEYRPGGEISEALLPGRPVRFIWSVRPAEAGVYRGTIWLYMLFIPRSGGEETRSVISAQTIEIKAVNFLGLGGNSARIVGSLGVVLGSMIGLDNFFSMVWKWVLRKRPTNSAHTG